MAEKTFKSPNFFEREIDLSGPADVVPFGTPAGFIGAAQRGPAFVPITVSNFSDFQSVFGTTDQSLPAVHALKQFLTNRNSAMFCRVLGAGSNDSVSDIATTEISGTVKNAGFKLEANGDNGNIRFISAIHTVQANEDCGDRSLTDNSSITFDVSGVKRASLVRAGIMLANHVNIKLVPSSSIVSTAIVNSKLDYSRCLTDSEVVVILSSSSGSFGSDHGISGVKVFNVSFDPSSTKYVSNVLNTDPAKFSEAGHLLYVHFPIETSVAKINANSSLFDPSDPLTEMQPEFAVLSGSASQSNSLALPFSQAYGRFDTRFNNAKTSKYVSQPFGNREFNLFHFESMDDGNAGNNKTKITISDLKLSLDENNKFSTFTVQVRDAADTDLNPLVLEEYRECTLNPEADSYIARKIGDRKISFSFDSQSRSERRLVVSGKHPNRSKYIRVVMDSDVENKRIPETSLPFGFRGAELLNLGSVANSTTTASTRMTSSGSVDFIPVEVSSSVESLLRTSVLPPVPMRLKLTRGEMLQTLGATDIQGTPSKNERTISSFCWGVKYERTENPLNPNASVEKNKIIDSLSSFFGISKLETTVTSSAADLLNNNKFSLSKVALGFETIAALTGSVLSVQDQMKSAIYFRNSAADPSDSYKLVDKNASPTKNLLSFASLIAEPTVFNQYSSYMKFNNFIGGGFDGLNILDKNLSKLNDRSTSQEDGGCATSDYVTEGLGSVAGAGPDSNNVNSYKIAVDVMTDPMVVNHNLLFVPDVRDNLVTDHIMSKVKKNGMMMYVMDIPNYDEDVTRLFEDSVKKPDVDRTIQKLQARFIDNNFTATYFPDVVIEDESLRKRVKVPASVAVAGAMGFSDKVSFAWFAPAGFNRASLEFVKNVSARLNVEDRNKLYEARINPIAVFPRQGFVIYGQKTLQIAKSALDRVNVRRLMIEIKRSLVSIANSLVFETNNARTRANFVAQASLVLSGIQSQAGVEKFQIVMDETNNTPLDVEQQKLNGKIIVIPTRSIEFIAIDFIITPSGVQFV